MLLSHEQKHNHPDDTLYFPVKEDISMISQLSPFQTLRTEQFPIYQVLRKIVFISDGCTNIYKHQPPSTKYNIQWVEANHTEQHKIQNIIGSKIIKHDDKQDKQDKHKQLVLQNKFITNNTK